MQRIKPLKLFPGYQSSIGLKDTRVELLESKVDKQAVIDR